METWKWLAIPDFIEYEWKDVISHTEFSHTYFIKGFLFRVGLIHFKPVKVFLNTMLSFVCRIKYVRFFIVLFCLVVLLFVRNKIYFYAILAK